MGKGFDLGDYVEVPDRIARFYERHPEGRIAEVGLPQVLTIGAKTFIGVTVAVYRTPDDGQPCVGTAWEPFPGSTSFTKDAEMMNAATSAIGRALVAAGILAKGEKIASRNEVRNRQTPKEAGSVPPAPDVPHPPANPGAPAPASKPSHVNNDGTLKMDILYALGEQAGFNKLQVDATVRRRGYEATEKHLRERVEAGA